MSVEVLKDGIELPGQSNLTWIFKVRLNGSEPVPWNVDSFDLNMWVREAIGRFPRHELGDKSELADLKENWSEIEPRLRKEVESQVQLGARIGITGMRSGSSEWSRAQQMPAGELPPLSDPQRAVAGKLGIDESSYARSLVAQEFTAASLLEKGKRLAEFLRRQAPKIGRSFAVESLTLNTLEERFDVDLRVDDKIVPVRIKEALVDDLFEAGSETAERSLLRILDTALPVRT